MGTSPPRRAEPKPGAKPQAEPQHEPQAEPRAPPPSPLLAPIADRHASEGSAVATARQMSAARGWMARALRLARRAACCHEVPVAALVVHAGQVIAWAHNLRELHGDPVAHAEILALRRAARYLGRWRLTGCTLVVTLEPCAMCAGALVNARVDRLIYGAADPRAGAVGSCFDLVRHAALNHRADVLAGIGQRGSAALLRRFFAARRRGQSLVIRGRVR